MNDSELQLLFIENCNRIDIYKYCPKCGQINELKAKICKVEKCKKNLFIHPINFHWKIYLEIPEEQNYARNYTGNLFEKIVFVSGSVLSPIMGITCNNFIELAINHGFETMTLLLQKFFYHSLFFIERGFDRIFRICLPKGCQLHFLNWIALQNVYGFSYDIIISEILNRYCRDSDASMEEEDEEEENKKEGIYSITNLLGQKFFESNNKIFGKSTKKKFNLIYTKSFRFYNEY